MDYKIKRLTFVGEVHGECGARPNAGDDILRPDLWHWVLFLDGHVEERRRDVGLSGAEHDHERRALSPELPLTFVNNVAEIAEIPGCNACERYIYNETCLYAVTRLGAQAWFLTEACSCEWQNYCRS